MPVLYENHRKIGNPEKTSSNAVIFLSSKSTNTYFGDNLVFQDLMIFKHFVIVDVDSSCKMNTAAT